MGQPLPQIDMPFRAHYMFDGWYSDSTYTKVLTSSSTVPAGGITMYARWAYAQYSVDDSTTPYTAERVLDVDPTNGYAPNYYELNLARGSRYLVRVVQKNDTYKPLTFLMRNGFSGAQKVDEYSRPDGRYLVFDVQDDNPYYLRVSQQGGSGNIGDGEYTITIKEISKDPISLSYDYAGGERADGSPESIEAYPYVRIGGLPQAKKHESLSMDWMLDGAQRPWNVEEDFFTGESSTAHFTALWAQLPSTMYSLDTTYTGNFEDALFMDTYRAMTKAFKVNGQAGYRYQLRVTLSEESDTIGALAFDLDMGIQNTYNLADSSFSADGRSFTYSFVPTQSGPFYFVLLDNEFPQDLTYSLEIKGVRARQTEIVYHENDGRIEDIAMSKSRISEGSFFSGLYAPVSGTRIGYVFSGWALDREGTRVIDEETYRIPTGSLNLYAVWRPVISGTSQVPGTYSGAVTLSDRPSFHGTDTRADMYRFVLKKGVTYTFTTSTSALYRVGSFLYDENTQERMPIEVTHSYSMTEPYATFTYTPTENQTVLLNIMSFVSNVRTRDLPYQLETSDNEVTAVLSSAGGTPSVVSRDLIAGSKIGALPTPKRAGYKFLGYFTAAAGGQKISADTVVRGDTTFYAHWRKLSTSSSLSGMHKNHGSWTKPLSYKTFSKGLVLSRGTSSVKLVPVKRSSKATVYGKVGSGSYKKLSSLTVKVSSGKKKVVKFKVVAEDKKHISYYTITIRRK